MLDKRLYLEYLTSTESFDEWKRKINVIIDVLSDLYSTELSSSETNVAGNLYTVRPIFGGISVTETGTIASYGLGYTSSNNSSSSDTNVVNDMYVLRPILGGFAISEDGTITTFDSLTDTTSTSDLNTSDVEVDTVTGSLYTLYPIFGGMSMTEKGTVSSYSALPTANVVSGDVYKITDGSTVKKYVWTGTEWVMLY